MKIGLVCELGADCMGHRDWRGASGNRTDRCKTYGGFMSNDIERERDIAIMEGEMNESEDEQAEAILWMLNLYLKHGSEWRQKATELLSEATPPRSSEQ